MPVYDSPIRIHHLIHHTSGLRDQWSLLRLAGWRPDDLKTTDDVLDLAVRQRQLNFPPGEQYLYCNTGYALLRIIIERVTNLSLREHAHQEIFAPLDMQHTHFHDDHNEVVKNRAAAYQQCKDGNHKISVPVFDTVGETGLFTNIEDFTKWVLFLKTAKANNDPFIEKLFRPVRLNNGVSAKYGSGMLFSQYRGLPKIQQFGIDAGYRSDFQWFPDQRLVIVTLGNVDALAPVELLSLQVADLYLEQLGTPLSPQNTEAPTTDDGIIITSYEPNPQQINDYVGCYYSEELRAHHDIHIVDGELRFKLYRALDDMECRFQTPDSVQFGEYLNGKFIRDHAGCVNSVVISTEGARNIECIKLPSTTTAASEPGRHDIKVPALSEPCQRATVSG